MPNFSKLAEVIRVLLTVEQVAIQKIDPEFESLDLDSQKKVEDIESLIDDAVFSGRQAKPITIPNAKILRPANVYALMNIFDVSKSSVIIFTEKLNESIYSRKDSIFRISQWLNASSERKLTILLKNKPEGTLPLFFSIFKSVNEEQIEIRISKNDAVTACNVSVTCGDDSVYKIKEYDAETSGAIETVVVHYSDADTTSVLKDSLNVLITDNYSNVFDKSFVLGPSSKKQVIASNKLVIDMDATPQDLISALSQFKSSFKSQVSQAV